MKRLTIGVHACTEILALLITFAWADGKLHPREKEGVREAAKILNLPKNLRDRIESLIEKPVPLDQLLLDDLSTRDKAMAFVAAAWMTNVDDDVDDREKAMLDELAEQLGFGETHERELIQHARDLHHIRKGKEKHHWADELMTLLKAIPPRLEEIEEGDVEVVVE
jgi:uncharacterized membrane protein YebE (DUF533 family)